MRVHPEILANRQDQVLRLLGSILAGSSWYLAGGTSLALQLGHRRSADLDWFSEQPLSDPETLIQALQETEASFAITRVAPGTLHGRLAGVRISFLEYRYPLLQPLRTCREFGCRLASLADLAAMKLAALVQRGSKKDFLDIYALGQAGVALPTMLDYYRTKFSIEDSGHVMVALAYFEDADRQRTPPLLWPTNWREIKKVIRLRVQDLTRPPARRQRDM